MLKACTKKVGAVDKFSSSATSSHPYVTWWAPYKNVEKRNVFSGDINNADRHKHIGSVS